MSLTVTIIAKLSGVDVDTARRALDTASAFDEPGATPPAEFTWGAGARCYALASISLYRPQLFWGGLLATIAIPFLLVVKVLHHG
ncbi:hypothetical protein [Paraburkholderia terrae]|uniref:hypothetical protein n=1 Tax=Paraburkholderia terrae TaxID=311230 RepID=UPI0020533571|nr:hypothetical protein [Paraburkholderia terrae]BDC45369.1 hypothetical protein PTKU15_86660 [Paraburkholderia terrae]